MSLDDSFPEDPCLPSLRYAASSRIPVSVPWTRRLINIGAGFRATDDPDQEPVTDTSAFEPDSSHDSNLSYKATSRFSVSDISSSSTLDFYSHLDLAIGASIGCSWAGASGRGKINETAKNNRRNAQSSSRATAQVGNIAFQAYPALTAAALDLLYNAQDPEAEFRRKYGEYFVSGVSIGAINSTLVGGDLLSAMRSKDMEADVTGKLLFIKKTKHFESHEREGGDVGSLSLTAFDSIEHARSKVIHATTIREVDVIEREAHSNKLRGVDLFQRAHEALKGVSLDRPSQDLINQLCEKGLVSELQLVPYFYLRDYTAAMLFRSNV